MRRPFAAAVYWVALAHRKDQWHPRAVEVSRQLGPCVLVTTEEVFGEFLNHFSGHGPAMRAQVARTIRELENDPGVEVIPQSHQSFLDGLALYESRPDKAYSLIDCISMQAMRREQITEVLTHDRHFAQEGFVVLL
jgi:uncharacterized protein